MVYVAFLPGPAKPHIVSTPDIQSIVQAFSYPECHAKAKQNPAVMLRIPYVS